MIFHPTSFESATDELDSDFPNQVKSKSDFADIQMLETQENEDYTVFDEMEISAPKDEFQLFEATGFEEDRSPEESADIFEIEVSDAEDLSNIFNSEESAEEFSSQNENSLFESSNEMILLPSESFDSLPAVEEFSQTAESFESAEVPVETQNYVGEFAPLEKPNYQETQELQTESHPEQRFEETQENLVTDNEYRADERAEDHIHKTLSPNEPQACPFCFEMNDLQTFVCNSCRAMISLSDLEMLLSHKEASSDVLEIAIEDLEAEKSNARFEFSRIDKSGNCLF